MKISAIIATYNRRPALEQCIRTLVEQDLPKDGYEIVVVVDGSSDGTGEMLRLLKAPVNLVVFEQENRGKSAALNAAVKEAAGEIVLIVDDDFLCDRALLSTHLAAHRADSRALVFGRIRSALPPRPSFAEQMMHEGIESYYARFEADPRLKWPEDAWAGPNCSMQRSAFLEAGGCDEKDFPRRAEDSDLGLRLWKIGVKFRFEPRATATHRWVKSNRQYWRDSIEDGASLFRLSRKHPETRPFWSFAGLATAPLWKQYGARILCSNLTVARLAMGLLGAAAACVAALPRMRRVGESIFRACTNLAGMAGARREAGSWRLLMGLYGRRLPALLYHQIGTPTAHMERYSITVTPERFRRHMRWLHWRGYVGITPAQWLAWCTEGKPLPKKPVLITFDDAYADLVENALPVVERYGHHAVVFVITELMREGKTWENSRVMTQEQAQEWAARGIEFGGHTRTHPDLTAESSDRVADEVKGSKQDLQAAGLIPVSFAYPFGCTNEQVRQAVDGVFPLAFTCDEGMNDLRTDGLLMKRTMVLPRDTVLDLEMRLALGRNPLIPLRARLRIRSRISRVWQSLLSRS